MHRTEKAVQSMMNSYCCAALKAANAQGQGSTPAQGVHSPLYHDQSITLQAKGSL
jgi:hypothetical protein